MLPYNWDIIGVYYYKKQDVKDDFLIFIFTYIHLHFDYNSVLGIKKCLPYMETLFRYTTLQYIITVLHGTKLYE